MPKKYLKKNHTKNNKRHISELAEPYEATVTALEAKPVPFAELGVPEPLLRVLAADGKTEAFPIQADTLPDSLRGRDILGRGRTGSGKTLAFCIPLAARLCEIQWRPDMTMTEYRRELKQVRRRHLQERTDDSFLPHPRGLVLAPTRELANQINDVLEPLARMAGMTTTTVYGGVRYNRQIRELKAGADIVVACPGRLEDLLRQEALTLSSVKIIVLDEADEMADMGFLMPVRRILAQLQPQAQHMLFSATLDHGIDEVVREFLRDPKTHSVAETAASADSMTQYVFEVTKSDKNEIVKTLASGAGRRILFTRTKFQAKNLAKKLTQLGIPAAELHGNLSQNQRDRNLAAFEQGDVNVMVATDVAARGIDISDVELVVQVDPPADPKSFVHRSGRTARAGKSGSVVTLVLPEQRREARRMLKTAGIQVQPVAVNAHCSHVLDLVGERAELVEGWSLDQSQPAGNPRKRGKNNSVDEAFDGTQRANRRTARRTKQHSDNAKALKHLPQASESSKMMFIDDTPHSNSDASTSHSATSDISDEIVASQEAGKRRDRDFSHRKPRERASEHRARREHKSEQGAARNHRTGMNHDTGMNRNAVGGAQRTNRAGKRIHRKDENRIVQDERSEAVKRHERRMVAKYGSADNARRRRSKFHRTPFRIG